MPLLGKDRLLRQLHNVVPIIEPAVSLAMAQWAEHISSQQRALVAVKTGRLKRSTDWTFGDAPKDAKIVTGKHRSKVTGFFLRVTLFSGSFVAFWARWSEFGTKARAPGKYRDEKGKRRDAGASGHKATKAHPYFWPVWRAERKDAFKAIAKAINTELKQLEKVR